MPPMLLHFESRGEGAPLLFIPGLGADVLCWDLQVPELSREFRVIRVDPRGAGQSPSPPGPYSLQEMADDAVEVLDHLQVRSAVVVGHSMGGGVAQCLASQHPERVAGLVLVGTAFRLEARALEVAQSWSAWLGEGLSRESFARGFLPWLFSRRFFENPRQVQQVTRLYVESPWPQPARAFASQLAACRDFDTRELLPGIRVPALVLTGSEDLVTPPDQGRALAERLPQGRFVELPGLAHACMGEGAPVFNRLVRDFVRELQQAGAFA